MNVLKSLVGGTSKVSARITVCASQFFHWMRHEMYFYDTE